MFNIPSRMVKHFKFASPLLAILSLALLFSACSEVSSPPTSTPGITGSAVNYPAPVNSELAARAPFTLTVWFAEDYYNEPPIVDLIKEFKQAYPNISITVGHHEWDNMRYRLREAINANNPPDLAHQHAFVFGAQNYAQPLDDLWQQWGSANLQRFMPGALEDVSWNNIRYGVPLDINTIFLIYNRQMFKAAGLPEPDSKYTYKQLLEDARKLTHADSGQYGVAIKPGVWDMYGLVRSNGGELLQENNGIPAALLDTAPNVQLMTFLQNLILDEKVSPMPIYMSKPQPIDRFIQRKAAMFFSGPWALKELEKANVPGLNEIVGTAPMPRGFDGRPTGSVQGGGSLFVPRGARNREAAFEFMKWASSPKYQMRLAQEMGRYPVLAELYNQPYFKNQPQLQPFLSQLNTARPYKLEAYAQADIVWEQAIAAIFNGSEVKTTLEDANHAIQSALKLPLSGK